MSIPRVSVVITAFNRADTLARAVDSVRRQTLTDWEIVVVDDASTDDTAAVAEGLGEPRLQLIRNEVNRGIGGAKNVGIEAARGAFVAFLDSDDDWHPEKLERQIAALDAAPGVPLCFTAFLVRRPDGGREVIRRPRSYGDWRKAILLGETTSLGSTLLARSTCFAEIGGFSEALTRMQDRDWILRYLDRYPTFVCLDEPLATIHNSGWPAAATVERSAERLFAHNRERLERWGRGQAALFRASLRFEMAVAHYRAGSKATMARHLAGALAARPGFAVHLARRGWRKLAAWDPD